MKTFIDSVLKRWFAWALFGCVVMLAGAHGFETFGGYAPCTLCLRQREVYWVAGAVALVGLAASQLKGFAAFRWWTDLVLAVVFAVGLYYAIYHAGAEWKWWPGPTTCSGGGKVNLSALAAIADGTAKIRPPACDQAPWRLFGLSMAGWNVLVSLKLMVLSAWAAVRARGAGTPR